MELGVIKAGLTGERRETPQVAPGAAKQDKAWPLRRPGEAAGLWSRRGDKPWL